ncbi:MAG: hydroxyisourate hydrolase [Hyphomicrobiales bacterium]|nr:hydroxyisourate hydrolase [Hyphomicrobiales bacterium]MBV9588455.1 hydroxyisourate hydrolase [Hyphomicrobiales bacterium]MBV9753392.1 hydroxyisourate hydrolase [Hyphomicrobiales bacterium]
MSPFHCAQSRAWCKSPRRFGGHVLPGLRAAGGRLTTHVLDTSAGRPAASMEIVLYALDIGGRRELKRTVTNADGRCDEPLLAGEELSIGRYEIAFQAGSYFRESGVALPEPAFLEEVPIRFGIADKGAHYHVPLLISPYGYSTYRGS